MKLNAYIVSSSPHKTRSFVVAATFRATGKVVDRFAKMAQANDRARELNQAFVRTLVIY
jgi:hypothetical protein